MRNSLYNQTSPAADGPSSDSVEPWPEPKPDPATGWRPGDSLIKYSNLYKKARLFLYLMRKGSSIERPYYAHYQVTRRCNFRCPSCQTWQDDTHHKGLSLDEMRVAAKNLCRIGVRSVAITGGEATLRKDIVEAVKLFSDAGMLVRFHTNGFLLSEGLIERLFRAGVADVYISLDSLNPDIFNRINGMTRPGTFERVLGNIRITAGIAKRFGGQLFLNTVIRPDNMHEVVSLHDFASELGVLIAFYAVEVADGDDPLNLRSSDPALKPSEEERKKLFETFEAIIDMKQLRPNSLFSSEKLLGDFRDFMADPDGDMHWSCSAGRMYLELLPEGTISVCNATPPILGYDYRTLPELYARDDREDIFNSFRTSCSGCICTRQLEHIAGNKKDLLDKARVYLSSMFWPR